MAQSCAPSRECSALPVEATPRRKPPSLIAWLIALFGGVGAVEERSDREEQRKSADTAVGMCDVCGVGLCAARARMLSLHAPAA